MGSPEDYCAFSCKAAGYCCNDYTVGSNQMISCAQACMMRTLGTSWADMATENHSLCARNGASGCSLQVGGRQYSFCSSCSDLTDSPQCKWGIALHVSFAGQLRFRGSCVLRRLVSRRLGLGWQSGIVSYRPRKVAWPQLLLAKKAP